MPITAIPNEPLTGVEVGRLVLRDLAEVYKNSRAGRAPVGIMTPAEKAQLVNSLTAPEDVVRYNEYRYVHEYLSRAAVMFLLETTTAESRFNKLMGILSCLLLAEEENANFLSRQPRIMTRKEYAEAKKLFDLGERGHYGLGVAVIETEEFPPDHTPLDKKGRYQPPSPNLRKRFMAETVLAESRQDLIESLAGYQAALKEALVIKTAVRLMGQFVGVPEVENVVGEVNLALIPVLNEFMSQIPPNVMRWGVFPDERLEEELKAELAEILIPIKPEKLKPSPAAVRKARRAVSFATAQGNSEKLYAILREEGE